ncbi:hypothetical protein AVEN_18437-1 [Araneus ventricosus]|uniref:C2H2-type domain-containing protein n=1 Tax=Araneus ventricosus TaxID=182803 RepID=A0A4Y2S6V9_ARAVE|nr:hypothetical protein AVEN_18437-1 [Araneus ventricosus]
MNFFPDQWGVGTGTKCCHVTSTVLQYKVRFLYTRVCKHCGLYFVSNVMLKKHIIGAHKITGKCQPEVGRVRPLRIAARRLQELMAVIAFTENVEFRDWVDEDDIDIRGLTIPEDERCQNACVLDKRTHIFSMGGRVVVVNESE